MERSVSLEQRIAAGASRDHVDCSSCKYCGAVVLPDKTIQLQCRLNPPTIAYGMVIHPQSGPQIIANKVWCGVERGDWCGKHEPKA